jgi:hypothetical protein
MVIMTFYINNRYYQSSFCSDGSFPVSSLMRFDTLKNLPIMADSPEFS